MRESCFSASLRFATNVGDEVPTHANNHWVDRLARAAALSAGWFPARCGGDVGRRREGGTGSLERLAHRPRGCCAAGL